MVCEASASVIAEFLRRREGVGVMEQSSYSGRISKGSVVRDTTLPPGQMNKPHRTVDQHTELYNQHVSK